MVVVIDGVEYQTDSVEIRFPESTITMDEEWIRVAKEGVEPEDGDLVDRTDLVNFNAWYGEVK